MCHKVLGSMFKKKMNRAIDSLFFASNRRIDNFLNNGVVWSHQEHENVIILVISFEVLQMILDWYIFPQIILYR